MKVLKFGGSSLANADKFLSVVNIVSDTSSKVSVVLSAPQGITNRLVELVNTLDQNEEALALLQDLETKVAQISDDLQVKIAANPETNTRKLTTEIKQQFKRLNQLTEGAKLLGHCPEQTAAQILSFGERISINLLSWIFDQKQINHSLIEPESFLVAEDHSGDVFANIDETKENFHRNELELAAINLMPGFVGVSPQGRTITLGRNGSDYSAAILAVCVGADVCEIWTDVDGVYNADPRLVKQAELVERMSFSEAIELSYFGAKILHPKTITPLSNHDIPCVIKNSLAPEKPGTLISKQSEEDTKVKAIASLDNVAMIDISGPGMKARVGMTSRIFSALDRAKVEVILISQSSAAYRISICVSSAQAKLAEDCLKYEFELEQQNRRVDPIDIAYNLSVVSLVGDNMQQQKGIAAKFFSSLSQASVNIIAIAQDSSERSISAVIRSQRTDDAVRICHRKLFTQFSNIDAFVIGCGTVGEELLNQIRKQQEFLLNRNIQLNVYGIASSKKLLLDPQGIELANGWKDALQESEDSFSLPRINQFVEQNHLLNPVIIDATSSEVIAMSYADYLKDNYHVVAANKKANTASTEYYQQLRRVAQGNKRRFLYETNVAAGLPVIDNLQNLFGAGDHLVAFEGILSGSLSYIFGLLRQGCTLSEATQKAKSLGYTEPNPGEDLSGLDVARKVLIIAREAGLNLELQDIKLQSLIPEDLAKISDPAEFMRRLPELDSSVSQLVSEAEEKNQALKYVAKIHDGICEVKIESLDVDHPLYSIQGGENALAIHTDFYQPVPFVIRGYGAGAAVTAAGLFADVLRTLVWDRE